MCPMFSLLTDATLINMELMSKYSSLRTISKYLGYMTTNNKREACFVSLRQQHTRGHSVCVPCDVTWLQATPSLTVPARTQNDPYTQ